MVFEGAEHDMVAGTPLSREDVVPSLDGKRWLVCTARCPVLPGTLSASLTRTLMSTYRLIAQVLESLN